MLQNMHKNMLTETRLVCFFSFREFELSVLHGSWVDAPECQQTRHTRCDLTLDLGSDSDYNVHVRAQCGSTLSPWTDLSPPFNRRDSKTLTGLFLVIYITSLYKPRDVFEFRSTSD